MKIKILAINALIFFLVPSHILSQTNDIREKVQEKLSNSSNIPFAYIGTVTDKSESTLQIDKFELAKQAGDTGEIEQVSTTDSTEIVSIGKTNKTIAFSDVAIGDFLVAMGYKNGNEVLQAKRVLVTEPIKESLRKSYFGTIVQTSKNKITFKTSESENSFNITKNTNLLKRTESGGAEIEIGDLNENDKVILVTEDELNIRTLFLLPLNSVNEEVQLEE